MIDVISNAVRAYIKLFCWMGHAFGFIGRCVLFVIISVLLCTFTIGWIMTVISCLIMGDPIKAILVGGEQFLLAALCLPALQGLFGSSPKKKAPMGSPTAPMPPYRLITSPDAGE